MPIPTISHTGTLVADAGPLSAESRLSLPFKLVLLYLVFEFGRPQDALPVLGALQFPMISLIALGIQLVKSKAPKFADRATKLFVILLVFMLFHIPFAVNNYWAFHTARAMALTFIGYLGVLTFVDSAKIFKTLINVWLAIHTYLAIWGLMHGGRGIGGWIGDENDFCLALNMALPYAYFMTFSDDNVGKKIVNLGMVVLMLGAIMATFSRGGFLGLIAVGLYCWFRSSRKIISGIVIGLFALLVLNFAPKGYWEEMSTIQTEYSGETKGTGAGREYEWQVGWKMFLANPILGVGQGNFPWEFEKYEGGDSFDGQSQAGRAAHSLYYTLMPELGLIGVFIFLGMNYCCFKDLASVRRLCNEKRKRIEGKEARFLFYTACAIEASLIGYLATGYFITVLYYPSFWILVGFAVALRKVALANDEKSIAAH
jgi:probable O-glycosylation ligase (exosortase A-associated)